ncbi:hypothetical protein [Anaerovibrio sp.]|uniref:hypothetical protein n=1 Tax=Anaerovibrio sp. TaxID=1872532 RepID=UPI0025BFF01A|nr:hypothetical protein [Anaerovibrio sp.]MBR2141977.1 hypothetical protein [Anaerovibrio sp.]
MRKTFLYKDLSFVGANGVVSAYRIRKNEIEEKCSYNIGEGLIDLVYDSTGLWILYKDGAVEKCDFLEITYETFPDANLRVVTNGLLLPKTDSKVFEVMKRCGAGFDISLYQPTKKIIKQIILKCLENDINCAVTGEIEKFFGYKYIRAKNDIVENLNNCLYPHCYFLLDGKLAKCAGPILYSKNQKMFEEHRAASKKDIIDIHNTKMNGYQINDVLNNPIDWCQYCSEHFEFDWEGNYKKL